MFILKIILYKFLKIGYFFKYLCLCLSWSYGLNNNIFNLYRIFILDKLKEDIYVGCNT